MSWPVRIATLAKGVGVSLQAFMASQSDGLWYDFSKTDRMFQENVGPTPADDPNEVIGLAISQRTWSGLTLAQVAAAATETVANGNFASATGWNVGAGWSIGSGVATASTTSSNLTYGASVPLASRLYQVEFDWVQAGGALFVDQGAGASASASTSGHKTFLLTSGAAPSHSVRYYGGTVSGSLDNVTAKEVSRYPATQATGSFKPTVQTGGAKGDATDDRLGTSFASSSGDAFNVYPAAIIPASLAATQVFAGAMDGASNGDYLAVTTGGALRAKVGATTLDSTGIDLRGGTHDLAYWTDGATLYLYADGAIVASGAWTGSRPTTAWNLFALNNNGTASNFTGATMKAALRGAQALTVSLANQICRAA